MEKFELECRVCRQWKTIKNGWINPTVEQRRKLCVEKLHPLTFDYCPECFNQIFKGRYPKLPN